MLGNKFQYSEVTTEKQSPALKKALELLSQARVSHKVMASHANGTPLAAETKKNMFKVILLDVGLANSLLGLNLHDYQKAADINLINQGGVSEQVVGQLLRVNFPYYIEPMLFYWVRQKQGASSEIDYVIQHGSNIVPIEVKSGSTGSLKSLHLYMAIKQSSIAVRINADIPSYTDVDLKTTSGELAQYTLLSLPFYLIGQLSRFLDEKE
jgi:predicted AAA+ superfamily ATPase